MFAPSTIVIDGSPTASTSARGQPKNQDSLMCDAQELTLDPSTMIVVAKTKIRTKIACPLCKREVVNPLRHMRSKTHRWSNDKATYARANFKVRRRKAQNTPLNKIRTYKQCPMPNCYALVTKIGDHMRSKHSVQRQQMFNEDLKRKLLQECKKW